MNKIIPIAVILIIAVAGIFMISRRPASKPGAVPSPTPSKVEQLPPDTQPQVSLIFSPDGHYVTINMENIQASQLEYNLIYDATVKKTQINTGVSGGTKDLQGKTSFSYKQLLGSESSGKFTYHESIRNAYMEVTLRNQAGYSVFSATYPFTVTAGRSISLTPSE
jgi:hypothetical protein